MSNIYEFYSNSPINLALQYRIKKRPEMSMKRLSELTDYPEIVSKSTFVFDTLILDETTTIPFCVITTKMLGNPDNKEQPYQNIFLVNDIFDSFIEHISEAKAMIEEHINKRVILFNRPGIFQIILGQSHTIYNEKSLFTSTKFATLMDKFLYRLSSQKDQLRIINMKVDHFKFVGYGFGGCLLASFLGYYFYYFTSLRGIMLINSFLHMPSEYLKMLDGLLKLYCSDDPSASSEAYLYYNKAIQSSELSKEDLQKKAGFNAIRTAGRIYVLESILAERHLQTLSEFENISSCPVHILYSTSNAVIPKSAVSKLLIDPNVKNICFRMRINKQVNVN